jgi:serine/threonine protein kinase
MLQSSTTDTGGYDAKKADIWSIGILLCEMVGGFTPFKRNVTSDTCHNQKQRRGSDEYRVQG